MSCARQAGRLIFHPAGHIEKTRINGSGYMLRRCRLSVLRGDGLSVDLRSRWRGGCRRWKSGQVTCWSRAGGLGRNERARLGGSNTTDGGWGDVACAVTALPLVDGHHGPLHASRAIGTWAHRSRTRAWAGTRAGRHRTGARRHSTRTR